MKIAVFFHAFEQIHEEKDPGQIVLGLNDIGIETELVTLEKSALNDYSNLPIRLISYERARNRSFWISTNYDVVIAYSWLRNDFLWIPQILKESGKRVIIKADTDGRYNLPIYPRWDMYLGNHLRVIDYAKIMRRRLKRRIRGSRYAEFLIEHMKTADCVIVETPQAEANLAYFLTYWKQKELVRKMRIIANPVGNDALYFKIPKMKQKRITAIGNWCLKYGSYYAKNTEIMINTLTQFLSRAPNYHAVIIGAGEDVLRRLINKRAPEMVRQFNIVGQIPHSNVIRFLADSQIFFMPSISEGLSVAASEAACMGCSIVGSPLESLQYLSQGEINGTLASDFKEDAYLGAVIADSFKWERGIYSAQDISSCWRAKLNRQEIARQYKQLAESLS